MNDPPFQEIVDDYHSMDKLCNMDIKRLYSNFQFSFNCITIIKDDKNARNPIEEFLLNYLEDFQFIVYDFYFNSETPENIDSTLNNLNCIICIEKECLLIEKVSLLIINNVIATLKARNAIVINTKKRFKNIPKTKEEIEANKEIDSFCYHFQTAITSNKFIQMTIRSVVGYTIRRFYCPSTHFKDASFFVFDKVREIKTYEESLKMAEIMCYADSFEKDELICQLMESILNNQNNEKIFYKDFNLNEFIELKIITTNSRATFSLVIHLKTFYIFLMKRANYPEDISIDFKNEIHFCSHYRHRCFMPFYGFIKERGKIIGFLYEFMCNDSLASLSENQMNNAFILTTISRIFQGISYLHSKSLIHRDIKPSNILLNHDFVPFISDFETIRHHVNDDDDETITQDIGSVFYSTPEQFKGLNISYPTDIYLFGLTIYFIFENDHLFSQLNSPFSLNKESYKVLPLTKGSVDMRNLYLSCVKYDPDERPTIEQIKTTLIKELANFSYFEEFLLQKTRNIKQIEIIQFLYENVYINPSSFDHVRKCFKLFGIFKLLLFYLSEDYSCFLLLLGNVYYNGEIAERDYIKARKYYESSARMNNYGAIANLRCMFEEGFGIDSDFLNSDEYNEMLAKMNGKNHFFNYLKTYFDITIHPELKPDTADINNIVNAGDLYYYGYGVQQNFELAKISYEFASRMNNTRAMNNLGNFYRDGYCEPVDYSKSRVFYEEAASKNNSDALVNLGNFYENGFGVDQDYLKAIKYYKEAASLQNSDALLKLGKLYENGLGVEKDYFKAKNYYELAASLNNLDAFLKLGNFYHHGLIEKPNYIKAKYFYELAIKHNNPDAYFLLADLYSSGEFFEIDISKAIEYFEKCRETENKIVPFFIEKDHSFSYKYRFNHYRYIACNDLGLIYWTVKNDFIKATQYIKEAGINEYPYGQNNFGLINQLKLNNIMEAEYMFKKAAKKKFALADYNLGYLYESRGFIEESIQHYIQASQNEDEKLVFHDLVHQDKRLEISKKFIVCLANLKIFVYYFTHENAIESEKYFCKSFQNLILNSEDLKYQFRFTLNSKNPFSYVKNFILNYPLFYLNFNEKSVPIEKQNSEINLRFQSIEKVKKFFNSGVKDSYDLDESIDCYEVECGNEEPIILEDPKKLFRLIDANSKYKTDLLKEIKEIIRIMESILYKPPYLILFGRIKLKSKLVKIESKTTDINSLFYEGIGLDIINSMKSLK